jgi:hypothetical protein
MKFLEELGAVERRLHFEMCAGGGAGRREKNGDRLSNVALHTRDCCPTMRIAFRQRS